MGVQRRFSREEILFIRRFGGTARLSDMKDALRRPGTSGIRKLMRRLEVQARKRGQPPLSRTAVLTAWKKMQRGEPVPSALAQWPQDAGRRHDSSHKAWNPGDDDILREFVGFEPIAAVAARVRRTRYAVVRRVRVLNLTEQAYRNCVQKVAARLHVSGAAVNKWCNDGKLRAWFEGRWRIVHPDDAEWLVENYRYGATDWARLKSEVSFEDGDEQA